MTAPSPGIPGDIADGQYIRQGFVNSILALLTQLYSYALGGFRTQKPYLLAHCAGQTVPTCGPNSLYMLVWTLDEQSDPMLPTSGTSNAATIVTDGLYDVVARVPYAPGSSSGGVFAGIVLGTLDVTNLVDSSGLVPDRADYTGPAALTMRRVRLTAGTLVRVMVWQNTGSDRAVVTGYGGTWLEIEWVGP